MPGRTHRRRECSCAQMSMRRTFFAARFYLSVVLGCGVRRRAERGLYHRLLTQQSTAVSGRGNIVLVGAV